MHPETTARPTLSEPALTRARHHTEAQANPCASSLSTKPWRTSTASRSRHARRPRQSAPVLSLADLGIELIQRLALKRRLPLDHVVQRHPGSPDVHLHPPPAHIQAAVTPHTHDPAQIASVISCMNPESLQDSTSLARTHTHVLEGGMASLRHVGHDRVFTPSSTFPSSLISVRTFRRQHSMFALVHVFEDAENAEATAWHGCSRLPAATGHGQGARPMQGM